MKTSAEAFLLLLFGLGAGCDGLPLGHSSRRDGGPGQTGTLTETQTGTQTGDAGSVSQPAVGGQCPEGYSPCGRGDGLRCYDLGRSQDNCGACAQACAPGIACQSGTCQQHRCTGALSFKGLGSTTGVMRALGDFDNDGILDMVGSAEAGGAMSLYYGAGDGTFPTQQAIAADPPQPVSWQALAADLDGDGRLDLIGMPMPFYGGTADGGRMAIVAVYAGTGNRTAPFAGVIDYPVSSESLSGPLVADFDGDGRLDLVVSASTGLAYWRGVSGGRLELQETLLSPGMDSYQPGVPMATDWNGDGVLDLVYSNFGFGALGFPAIGGGGNLRFRLGRGDGSFDAEVACALLAGAIGDLDHDGRLDLINGTGLQGASLLLGIESCHASKVVTLSGWPKIGGVRMADLDGDGNLDVVADNEKNIMVRVGDGQGGFRQSLSMSAYHQGPAPISILLTGDLNRDGKMDIVFSRDGGWGVLLNTCK